MSDGYSVSDDRILASRLLHRFFAHAVSHAERRFWIGRVYERLEHEGLSKDGMLKIPRAIRCSLQLGVVAAYWEYETKECKAPSAAMVADWLDRFGDASLGTGWQQTNKQTPTHNEPGGLAP